MWRDRRRALRAFAARLAIAIAVASCGTVTEPTIAPGHGAEVAAGPLTRARCVELALQSAPTVAAWEARLRMARSAARQAGLLPNPELTASWEDFALGGAPSPVQQTFSLGYALEKLLARPYEEAIASAELRSEIARLRKERSDLEVSVRRAYDGLLAARRRRALASDRVAAATKAMDAARRFAGAGLAPRIDVTRAEVDLADAQSEETKAQLDARAQEISLAFAIGMERPVPIQTDDVPTAAPIDRATPMEERLERATARRPETAEARAGYDAALARLQLAASRVALLPALSFGYRRIDGENRGVGEVTLALPIFDSGAEVEEGTRAALLGAAAELRRTARDVVREAVIADDAVAAAEEILARHRAASERKHALVDAAEKLFRAGSGRFADWLEAARAEADSRLAVVEAELALSAAAVDYDAAFGTFAGDAAP